MRIKVIDEGIGIPEGDLEKVFDTYFRTGNVTGEKGSGIGLAIVKEAVETCGGTISLESTPGKGTTFIVEVPGYGNAQSE